MSQEPKKHAIVTGSESGIGRAIVGALAREGFDIGVTWYRSEAAGEDVADEVRTLGRRAIVRRLDVSDPHVASELVGGMADELGGLCAFVNNAGVPHQTDFLDLDLKTWNHVLGVNLTGAFAVGQAAARRMIELGDGGRIVNVTSVHEHLPLRFSAAYCASKGGLGLLTKAMAVELGGYGITVNAVAPGETATPMTGMEGVDPRTILRPNVPVGRLGAPSEVADVVAFLCRAESSYITGASFVVDGGASIMGVILSQKP